MAPGAVAARRERSDDTWRYLDDPRMPATAHGWKLHVSARPAGLEAVVDVVVAALAGYVCHIKFAKDAEVLRALNSGRRNPGAVGKAVTVYPRADEVREVALVLVGALGGREGPRIPSDRRVDPGAPVYYRYGPFEADVRRAAGGRIEMVMVGPGGEAFDGFAVGEYRCPPWAVDPFAAAAAAAAGGEALPAVPAPARLLGGRFRITAGLARGAQGDVYRAVDTRDGAAVVIKQARAFVGEDLAGADARSRLRNELRVLRVLDGVPGVPRALDYFRHGSDEFLAMTDCGHRDLRRDVLDHGPRAEFGRLASDLLRILDAVHARGVVVRDIKPGNVVLGSDGGYCLVDFGIAHVGGVGPGGATPGYSMPMLREDATAEPADDYYALGVTLAFALTGLDPVIVDPSPGIGAERTLAGLELALDDVGAKAVIRRLMSPDGGVPAGLPAPPRITGDLLEEVIGHTVAWCVERSRATDGAAPVDVYAGSSGLGWELLRHGEVDEAVRLARWTAGRRSRALSAGFYSGRGGVAYFLAEAGVEDSEELPDPGLPRPDGGAPEADVVDGAAGAGLSHLLLAGLGDAERHLAAAGECAALILAGRAVLSPVGPPKPGNAALADGLAHGRAGVAYFLHEYAAATGDRAVFGAAQAACGQLAESVPEILAAAVLPGATRRYVSWCRGLAGIGAVLARTGHRDLAQRAADVCVTLAPRVQLVGACCGLAGVGELLVDLARWDDAEQVARIILARSGGTWSRPLFPDADLDRASATWAGGSVGVLGFLRRLRDRGGARLGFLDEEHRALT